MKLLMLRGQVPQDRDPQEIVFDDINKCDDTWTRLVFAMTSGEDETELWYWGGRRKQKFAHNFTERWVPSFSDHRGNFIPDVIFCRGGFPEYHSVLNMFPEAVKIYYGAGPRFLPIKGFYDYDIILVDSVRQLEEAKNKFPNIFSTLFIKPAPDNLFYPVDCEKKFDVCFPANGAQKWKGHKFVYSTIPKDINLLNLGNNPYNTKFPDNVVSRRVLKHSMAKNISLCKVGIIASDAGRDSCPRVVPEMLACGVPIVSLDRVHFWHEKYIVPGLTGELATTENFWDVVRKVVDNYKNYKSREYYENNLTTQHAAKLLRGIIDEVSIQCIKK